MIGIEKTGMFIDNVESFVDTTIYRGGEIGLVHNPPGKDGLYQLVKLDATADAAGVAKDVVYWHTPASATITTTIGESESGTNMSVAGVITVALPISSYAFLKLRGKQSTKAAAGTKGVPSVPHTGSNQVTDNLETLFTKIIGTCVTAAAGGFADIRWNVNPV